MKPQARRVARLLPIPAVLASLLVPVLAGADRPSLLDLQAAIDDLVSPSPPAAVGRVLVSSDGPNTYAVELVSLRFDGQTPLQCLAGDCVPSGVSQLSPVQIEVVASSAAAELAALALTPQPRDLQIDLPSEERLLVFDNAVVRSAASGETSGRLVLEFEFDQVTFQRLGASASWNRVTRTAAGCSVRDGERHIDLAGNSPTNIQRDEIEAPFMLELERAASLPQLIRFDRLPPNPCRLRGLVTGQVHQVNFDRLWSGDDQFPGRSVSESIDVSAGIMRSWSLVIESGVLRESIALVPNDATVELRDFSPADGRELNTRSFSF